MSAETMQSPSDLVPLVAEYIAAEEPDLPDLLEFMHERLDEYAEQVKMAARDHVDDPDAHAFRMMKRSQRNIADARDALKQAATSISCAIAAEQDAETGAGDEA